MTDWTEQDISQVSESEFPVSCDRCEHALTGLGDRGVCPQCGHPFSRRKRLWQTYGPEVFASPPIPEGDDPTSLAGSDFVAGLLMGLAMIAALPISLWIASYWLASRDLWFLLFAWLVIVAAGVWLTIVRRRRGRDRKTTKPSKPRA